MSDQSTLELTEGQFLGRLIQRYRTAAAKRVHDLNDDAEVAKRLKAAGIKLKPGEVYSLGVSRVQIVTLSPKELAPVVTAAQERAAEDGNGLRPSSASPRRRWDEPLQTWVEVGA